MATKQEIIAQYQLHEGDTGSPEVQIALLTERIITSMSTSSSTKRITIPAVAF